MEVFDEDAREWGVERYISIDYRTYIPFLELCAEMAHNGDIEGLKKNINDKIIEENSMLMYNMTPKSERKLPKRFNKKQEE